MSSKFLDEDDFYDEQDDFNGNNGSEADEFVEDDLPDDEYDLLHERLPVLKTHFVDYNNKDIDEFVLKKYLWLNYFNVDDAVLEIKSIYKSKPKPKPTHLVAGSSKLALLLLKRLLLKREKEQEQEGVQAKKAISILDSLSGNIQGPAIPKASPRGESILKRKIGSTKVESKKSELSKDLDSKIVGNRTQPKIEESTESSVEQKDNSKPQMKVELLAVPSILIDKSLLINAQTQFSNLFAAPTSNAKKRKLENHGILKSFYSTNQDSIIVKKITTNFSKPSPDDVVLQAQANLFNDVNKKLNKMAISSNEPTKKAETTKLKKNTKVDITKELSKVKPQLSFVIFGHVDSGKSTIVGRLLYDLKIVDSKTLHKLQQQSDQMGKSSFLLAWIMDQTEEERSRGVTVDIVATSIETEKLKFNIIDSPGHRDYVPQLINGIAQADVGVLIIDCNDFSNGFLKIKEQVLISKNLGIDNLIICLNKFDLIDYDESHLKDIIEDLTENLAVIGYESLNLQFVPVSGLLGDNIVQKSSKFSWDKTLIDCLHQEVVKQQSKLDKELLGEPFIMTLNEILDSSTSKELKVNGRVNSGFASNGDEFITFPNKASFKLDHKNVIMKGDFVNNLKLKLIGSNNPNEDVALVVNGDLLTNDLKNFEVSKELKADLRLFELKKPLLIGTSFVLFHNCKQYPAKIKKINSIFKRDAVSGMEKSLPYKKKHLVTGSHANVIIETEEPLPFNTNMDKLTRIVIRKDIDVIGCGKIETQVCI